LFVAWTAATIHVGLPGSGAALLRKCLPTVIRAFDPRSLYIFIAGTEPVREAAASEVNMSVEDFSAPQAPA